jgi:putative oxidoreductase
MKDSFRNIGLLILRVGIGVIFIIHGAPKMFGGPEKWAELGAAMSNFGIDSMPKLWGFLSALAEFGGGIFIVIGMFTRVTAIALTLNMAVAVQFHFVAGDSFQVYSHALEAGILFLSLIFIGPGSYSVDHFLFSKKKPKQKPVQEKPVT